MLGFIMDGSDTLVFEFRDDSGLIDCLSDFGDTRDANVIVIADTSDRVVATIANRDTDDRLDDLRNELVPNQFKSIDVEESFFRLTDLGKLFIEACIK